MLDVNDDGNLTYVAITSSYISTVLNGICQL